ncbi:hypothetical protein [Bdellovibrio bacteriovorus]|uniref:hypothetical protein n=1 Tax=Bdellovibrio TaxID=958 RepID=UPI0035A8690F
MKLLKSLLPLCVLLFASACSLSKDEKVAAGVAPLHTTSKNTDTQPSTHSLIISEFHRLQQADINNSLSKNLENKVTISAPSEDFKTYLSKFDSVFVKISENNISGAIIALELEKMSCEDVELSVAYTYMSKSLKSFEPFANFLSRIGCSSKTSSTKVFELYKLEAKRQFHSRFSDVTLLKYLIHHINFVKSTMIPMSNSGIAISLSFLYQTSKTCYFHPEQMGQKTSEGDEIDFVGCDRTFEDNIEADIEDWEIGEKNFLTKMNLQREEYDVTYIKDGRMTAAVPSFRIIKNEVLDGFPAQVTMYMNGYWDSPDRWKDSLSDILRADLMEGM